ncbi:MAG: hypothetical protein HC921_01775 [Synechococcaceae cyanobacterium SM2_3_1]|nr:hypothetical protein [Synechococcaceae cyanobacterium SM2_3_1]
MALPGFHIYLASKVFEKPIASIHYDLQHELAGFARPGEEIAGILSFTLVTALPLQGGGLNWWNLPRQKVNTLSQAEKLSYLQNNKQFFPYQLGYLYTHSGKILHQAAPGVDLQPDDQRITLQGHAFLRNNVWVLYW